MDITTTIAGIRLEHPIFNAAGPRCVTKDELERIGQSKSAAIMSKSCTLESRKGNPEPRYYEFGPNSINSMGLPNLGYKEYASIFPNLTKHNKPLFISASGLKLEDNLVIIKKLCKIEELDGIELNLSCPNIIGKPQMGYDFEQSKEVLEKVGKICTKPLGVKLPPYFDMAHFKEMASILDESKVKFVTCINSPGNGLVIDADKEEVVIKPKGGFGGIGGPAIKPHGLANVRMFRELLKPEISVVGVGGITTGKDVFEYLLAGADAVQLGTVFMQENTFVFERILNELAEVMRKKRYSSLDEFKGKLKVL